MQSMAISIDAPIDGWNAFDSLDNMPPTSAVILDNLIPSTGTVDTRRGTATYADTGTGLPVETVAALETNSVSKIIAASNGGLFDVSNPSSVVTLAAASTFSNDRWQTSNFRKLTEDGILILCNGVDDVQILESPYGALNLGAGTFTDESAVPVASNFIGVCLYKGRAFYWFDDDNSVWYAEAGSYQGVIKEFELGSFVQSGGKLVAVTTWTQQDSGDGKDDFLVFVFSTGEILIYQGDDPDSAGFFEMVGRYRTAPPLSIRGTSQYGADTIIMTKDGYIALSTIVQQGRISDVNAFSRLIHNAIVKKTTSNSEFFGWDCELFSKQGLFLFNVPTSAETAEQHVLNTVTQRWCRFTGINVLCLEVANDRLFGGAPDGTVLAILEGTSDKGNAIEFNALPAFNYFGDPGNQKFLTAAQVITTHSSPTAIQLSGLADFNYRTLPPLEQPADIEFGVWSINPPSPPASVGSNWDEDYWALDTTPFTTKGWQNVSAYGYAVSVQVRFLKISESVSWRSTGIRFHKAGAQ